VISFRYHLITIVSVFLAIALGIVMGTTFVQDPLLDSLRDRTEDLARRNQAYEDTIDRLGDRVAVMNEFAEAVFPQLATARLDQVPVVLLTQAGTADDDLDATRTALERAGAVLQAELVVQPRIQARGEGAREALADALGMSRTTQPGDLTSEAAERIGHRLADGADGATPETDILATLLSDGFITSPREPDVSRVGGLGTVVVVVAGGADAPAMEVEDVLLPIMRALSTDGLAAAAQATDSEYPFVPLVRSDDTLAERMSTVDDIELAAGQLALVLAVEDLIEGDGVGHYGVAGSALPPLEGSPQP
jgi:hypothetical protein